MQDSSERQEMVCPLNGKLCINGKREDFPKDKIGNLIQCRLWVHLYGKDPQSEKTIDQWDCAWAWVPTTTIEGAQASRFAAASSDKVANEVHTAGRRFASFILKMARRQQNMLKQIKDSNSVSQIVSTQNGENEILNPDE